MRKHSIGIVSMASLLAAAVIVDGIQFIIDLIGLIFPPISLYIAMMLGMMVSVSASFLFAIWFSHLGVDMMRKRTLAFLLTLVSENTPFLNGAPGWTWLVVATILKERTGEMIAPKSEPDQGRPAVNTI